MVKLLIWGTGDIAKRVLENGLNGELIGFVETKKERKCLGDCRYIVSKKFLDWLM